MKQLLDMFFDLSFVQLPGYFNAGAFNDMLSAQPESKGYFTWICRFALETQR